MHLLREREREWSSWLDSEHSDNQVEDQRHGGKRGSGYDSPFAYDSQGAVLWAMQRMDRRQHSAEIKESRVHRGESLLSVPRRWPSINLGRTRAEISAGIRSVAPSITYRQALITTPRQDEVDDFWTVQNTMGRSYGPTDNCRSRA